MLREIKNNIINIADDNSALSKNEIEFCYSKNLLSKKEHLFNQNRSTMGKLIRELDKEMATVKNIPYYFINMSYFNGATGDNLNRREEELRKYAEENRNLIHRNGYGAVSGQEVITRPKKRQSTGTSKNKVSTYILISYNSCTICNSFFCSRNKRI